jgi:hypothetical protein
MPHGTNLVAFGIVTQLSGNRNRFGNGVDVVPMTALASPVREPSARQLIDQIGGMAIASS